MNLPIIRLEIEHMKQSILHAFSEHLVSLDEDVRAAVEAYCTPDRLGQIIQAEVQRCLDDAVKEEIRSFFQYSKPGRQAVREAVIQHLNEWDEWG